MFKLEQEVEISKYIKRAADIYFDLSPKDVRILAYQCAKHFGIAMPQSWTERESAGADWFTPNDPSIGRAIAFNKEYVAQFFLPNLLLWTDTNLIPRTYGISMKRASQQCRNHRVVAATGVKQIGSLTSAGQGELVTVCVIQLN